MSVTGVASDLDAQIETVLAHVRNHKALAATLGATVAVATGCGGATGGSSSIPIGRDVSAKIHSVHLGQTEAQVKQQLGSPDHTHSDYGFTYWSYGTLTSHMYELEFEHGKLAIILPMNSQH